MVLLGESVARGYFYDPHFNPASVLQTILESVLGPEKIDVVDLARSNLRIPELRACIGQSLALSPDVLVIFAGNNWHPHLSESDIPYVESLLRQQGVPGMKAYLDEKREQTARNLITQANGLLAPRNVKIVWVIPEFNLRDWADPSSGAPLLPGDGNKRWRELDVQMRQAVRDADWACALKSAEQMTRLDGGTSSVPLRVLATCCHAQTDIAAERGYLELCREAEGWDPSFSFCPRVFLSTQKALREASALPGNAVVDLPEIFGRYLDGGLPSRQECAQLMARFAEYVTCHDLPMMLCKPMLEFDALDRLDTRDYLGHGRMRRLDITFGDAAVAALADIGIEIEREIADLRINEHSPRSGPKELTDFFYCAVVPAISERGWTSRSFPTNRGSHSIYASAFWETSVFVFFAEKGQDIGITFTYRVRLSSLPHGTVTVDVNGSRLAELPAEPTWCTRRIFVPNEYIADGLNKISIAWPTDEPTADVLLTEAADSLLAMRLPYFSRVFGEIHTLSVG